MQNVHAFLYRFLSILGPKMGRPGGPTKGQRTNFFDQKSTLAPQAAPRPPKTAPRPSQDTPKTPPRQRKSTPKSNGNQNKIMYTTSLAILTFNVVFNARSRPSTTQGEALLRKTRCKHTGKQHYRDT